MGLRAWLKMLGLTSDSPAATMADHTETAAREAQRFWQLRSRYEVLADYVRACIDTLPQARRDELESSSGLTWQDGLRKEYEIDETFDALVRNSWRSRTQAAGDTQAETEPFVHEMIDLHLAERIKARVLPLRARSAAAIRESYQRKLRSERSLRWRGIGVCPTLPVLESSYETTLRDSTAVRNRAAVLFWSACAYDPTLTSGNDMMETMRNAGLDDAITPNERTLLSLANPTEEQRRTLMWNFESCLVLLWALGLIRMGSPRRMCHQDKLFQVVRRLSASPLRVPPLRPVAQILDEWDATYRRHWSITQSMFDRLRDKSDENQSGMIFMEPRFMDALRSTLPPAEHTHAIVVKMRHHALNWLVAADGPDWDDVSTDT